MKPGMQWPIGIVAILSASVAGNVAFMRAAKNDPAFSVEPDYYKKAVAFDTTMDQARKSSALGWTANASITSSDDEKKLLTLQMMDGSGEPVRADSIRVHAFFVARANDVTNVLLSPSQESPGVYSAPVQSSHTGQWEVRVSAYRNADHFVTNLRTEAR